MTILNGLGGGWDPANGKLRTPPMHLKEDGMIVKCEVGLNEYDTQQRERRGVPKRDPVQGLFLIDTGSGESGVRKDILIDYLQLNADPMMSLIKHVGKRVSPLSQAAFRPTAHYANIRFVEPASDAPLKNRMLLALDLDPKREIIGIIGRDILRLGLLAYNGVTGEWTLAF